MSGIKYTLNPDWQSAIVADLHQALTSLGEDILSDMQRDVPVDTGKLKRSLKVEVTSGDDISDQTLSVSTDVNYAMDVELGTKNMKARPFMRPAVLKQRTLHK